MDSGICDFACDRIWGHKGFCKNLLSVHDQSIWTPLTAPTAGNIDEIHFAASSRPYEKSTAFCFVCPSNFLPLQEREQLNCKRKVDRSVVDALRRNLAFNAVVFSGPGKSENFPSVHTSNFPLRRFEHASKFRRACLSVMAWSLTHEERKSAPWIPEFF